MEKVPAFLADNLNLIECRITMQTREINGVKNNDRFLSHNDAELHRTYRFRPFHFLGVFVLFFEKSSLRELTS